MLAAKLKMLKNLQKQMHCLMAEGHGDDEDAGKEAVAKVADAADDGEDVADKLSDEDGDEGKGDDDDLAAQRKSFFKRTGKITPKKGTMVVMVAGKSAPQASGKSLFASGMKPGKRHG
jgi:hypothetical protein